MTSPPFYILVSGVKCLADILSPEEKLYKLATYLRSRDPRALELFASNSSLNQLLTFLQSGLFSSGNQIAIMGEYIVLQSCCLRNDCIFIIGLDDNYRFFCHRLPTGRYGPSIDGLNEEKVRDLMGFDYHAWEMRKEKYREGVRVRLQGDIVLRFERIFNSEEEIYAYLCLGVFFEIANVSISPPDRLLREIIRRIREISDQVIEIDDPIRILKYILGGAYVIAASHQDRIVEEMRRISSNIRYLEHKLNIVIGNHRLHIIGVIGMDIVRSFRIRIPELNERNSILVLRPQNIIAMHDEHKTASLYVPRSIIRINTLEASPHRVAREDTVHWVRTQRSIAETVLNDIEKLRI